MSYLIFFLIFITGLLIAFVLSDKFKAGELLGLPFLIGLGYTSFVMFFLDALKIGIHYWGIVAVLAVTIIAATAALLFLYKKNIRSVSSLKDIRISFTGLTLSWLCFFAFGAYLVYGITVKCLYYAPAEFDSIEGYDLLAKAIAHEGTIANSVLLNPAIVAGCGPRLLYPPLFASCNAICYLSGMESPKIITALFFISWLITFYSLIKRFVPATAAIAATFMMMIAPELFANASFTLTNLPTAAYASTAVVSFYIWHQKRINGFFYLSIILLLCATWTRSDAIVFYPGIMLVLLYDAWKTKKINQFIAFGSISAIPFILWHFYLTAHVERKQDLFFIKKIFFDGKKFDQLTTAAQTMIFNNQLYGIVFHVFCFAIVLTILYKVFLFLSSDGGKRKNIFKADDRFSFMVVAVGGWVLYTLLFYQMKDIDGSLFAPGGWMFSGYKRGMFCFVPLAMFYCVANPVAMKLYSVLGVSSDGNKP